MTRTFGKWRIETCDNISDVAEPEIAELRKGIVPNLILAD